MLPLDLMSLHEISKREERTMALCVKKPTTTTTTTTTTFRNDACQWDNVSNNADKTAINIASTSPAAITNESGEQDDWAIFADASATLSHCIAGQYCQRGQSGQCGKTILLLNNKIRPNKITATDQYTTAAIQFPTGIKLYENIQRRRRRRYVFRSSATYNDEQQFIFINLIKDISSRQLSGNGYFHIDNRFRSNDHNYYGDRWRWRLRRLLHKCWRQIASWQQNRYDNEQQQQRQQYNINDHIFSIEQNSTKNMSIVTNNEQKNPAFYNSINSIQSSGNINNDNSNEQQRFICGNCSEDSAQLLWRRIWHEQQQQQQQGLQRDHQYRYQQLWQHSTTKTTKERRNAGGRRYYNEKGCHRNQRAKKEKRSINNSCGTAFQCFIKTNESKSNNAIIEGSEESFGASSLHGTDDHIGNSGITQFNVRGTNKLYTDTTCTDSWSTTGRVGLSSILLAGFNASRPIKAFALLSERTRSNLCMLQSFTLVSRTRNR